MDEIFDISEANVASILQQWPQTNQVFFNQKTACVGCYLSRFCTLAEVAASYELPLDILLEKLRVSIQIPNEE
jgi:hybrid cluster-associated redox disulfide protein